jgi:D-alanyl-D-alanine carboxypeptidase
MMSFASHACTSRAPGARLYRSVARPAGMIHPGDVVVRSFVRIGWEWGGNFTSIKDYMHFSLTGK